MNTIDPVILNQHNADALSLLIKILDKEKNTLRNLPSNLVKLYIFSTIYLPDLNKLMKWQSPI